MKLKLLDRGMVMRLVPVIGIGIVAGCLLPASSYKEAAAILASFAGVIVAALVPTMILAATILSPVAKGKNEFQRVRTAVAKLISFFSGLFLLTIVLGLLLFLGALLDWEDIKIPIRNPIKGGDVQFYFYFTRLLGGLVVALTLLIMIQMTVFVQGVRSLFILHADNAEKELNRLIKEQNKTVAKAALPKDPRSGLGGNIGELS